MTGNPLAILISVHIACMVAGGLQNASQAQSHASSKKNVSTEFRTASCCQNKSLTTSELSKEEQGLNETRSVDPASFEPALDQFTNDSLSSVPNLVTSGPQNTPRPSDDIVQCITTRSSMNLTVQKETTLSYIQHGRPVFLHNASNIRSLNTTVIQHESRAEQTSFSERRVNVKDKLSSHNVQHRDEPPQLATGSCSIFIEAPPGKVLSILFLNQTCSRDNQVKVEETHDGWSTALDGCSPWKSPGYDVTTANRSAVMVVDLHNLVDFFRLEIHIQALVVRNTDGFLTRYVSSALGYIQTPGWHPFTRPVTGSTQGTAVVMIPSSHVTFISVVYSYLHFVFYFVTRDRAVELYGRNRRRHLWVMDFCAPERPGSRLVLGPEFRVRFLDVRRHFFYGIRVLFSFHKYSARPSTSRGLWNCSVPSWSDFRQHFMCNDKAECAGREDEMWCPATSCQQGGLLLGGTCYNFLLLANEQNSWHHAYTACKQKDATLASFPTADSWYHLALLSQVKKAEDILYIGLESTDVSDPHMYRYAYQWTNGSIAHYIFYRDLSNPPFCAYVSTYLQYTTHCSLTRPVRTYAVCQMTSFPADSMSRKRIVGARNSHRSKEKIQSPFRNTSRELFPFPSIQCPSQHWTQGFLACDAFSACWRDADLRSSDVNATTDTAVTPVCVDVDVTSLKALFPCQNGASSVPYSLVCNHLQDCADNSDEDFCAFPACSAVSQYRCANGQCLPFSRYCDEFVHCLDETDELDCSSTNMLGLYSQAKRPRPPVVADFDGRGAMVYTPLTRGRGQTVVVCPDTHLLCPGDGYCLPVYVRCNGVYDCPGAEDEDDCDKSTCPGLYRCRGLLNTCLHPDHLCDGWPQCPQHDDELFCNLTCPVNCNCLGHAFTCTGDFDVEQFSRLRYLDAGGTGLEPERLVNNTMLVHLSLARCGLVHLANLTLPNLLSLDLSDNRFSVVTTAVLNLMENLRNLSLARNPLSGLFSGNLSSDFLVHKGILHVDLTGVHLKVLDMPSYLPFPSLHSLNLSGSGVTRLVGDGFSSLASLCVLDLRGCPMTVFPRRIFKGLNNLGLVFADNYKLCCEASLPTGFNVDNCAAPFDEVSSCDALLRADVYRVCLSVLAALALSGNLGCFCLRIFSLTGRGKTGFNVFVTHLCVSDFVMGVYMAMVGIADRLYLGKYLWEEHMWRHSAACQVAGVLALLSSEVSAFIICLITLDRFLVIRFPFSRLRFSSFSAQIASVLTWTVGVVLVAVPLLPVTAYRHFYGQTGICVPLPITRNDFTGHHYAFGVMILLNLVVFILIATGQISVYLSMTSNAMSSVDTTRKSRDLIVARRLITVVVTDFLCWFPLGLLGVLAAQGVPVPGEVNVAMAIFVLPLNSALNPFLYTLNMIQEKRQRATEVKLLKMILELGINDDKNFAKE